MRSCRRFLAGIPHHRVGHPCVTHPSATPSSAEAPEDVRLACVRHAASVYPEPGSNSPSMFYVTTAGQRPTGGVAPWVHAIQATRTSLRMHVAVRRLCAPPPARCLQSRGGRALILTGTAVFAFARVHPVAVLLSTLQLSRYHQKQVMPASSLPFGDKYSTPGAKSRFTERRSWVQFLLRRNLQEVCLIEVATPSLLATKLLCHSPYRMSRVFGKIFVNL